MTITAVNIPFLSLVWQLIKLALAAVPAIFVLGVGLWGSIVLYSLLAPELSHLLSSVWLDLTQLRRRETPHGSSRLSGAPHLGANPGASRDRKV